MVDFKKLKEEYEQISKRLSLPEIYKNKEEYQKLSKRFSFLEKVVSLINERDVLLKEKQDLEKLLSSQYEDEQMKVLAAQELSEIEEKIKKVEEKIEEKLFEDIEEERDIIVEIRSAAGGEEAALFAGDLFRMYSRYAEKKGWRIEILSSHPTELGGFKEIIFSVKGKGCFSHFKFESGVHRVQRIPVTESGGRIHTSTATVAVLVEPQEIELKINPDELKIETFRASGHGGQHVNRTDSAVRITHLPSGIVVSCQDERSQIKNREKAMRVLKARLLDKLERERTLKVTHQRKVQIGTGERSEKIRTYNFPERRVTDHRINLTVYRLNEILEGDLDILVDPLRKEEKKKIYETKGLA